MKRFLLAGATLLALTAAQPTLAADAPVYKGPAPVAVALFNWSGFYLGIQGGYGWGRTDRTYTDGYTPPTLNIDGWLLGGYAGVNWQMSSIVLGIEGDINWASIRGSGFDPGPGYNLSAEAKWLGSIRGRLGFAADRALFFLTAGWAWGNFDHFIAPAPAVSFNGTHHGWTVGGGLEWAFANNILGRVEYRYYDFGRKDYPAFGVWLPHNFKPVVQTLTVGAAMKF